jgi:hypothetical protein
MINTPKKKTLRNLNLSMQRLLGGNDEDRQLWWYDFKIIALTMKLEQDYNLLKNGTPYSIPTIGTSVIRFMKSNYTNLRQK